MILGNFIAYVKFKHLIFSLFRHVPVCRHLHSFHEVLLLSYNCELSRLGQKHHYKDAVFKNYYFEEPSLSTQYVWVGRGDGSGVGTQHLELVNPTNCWSTSCWTTKRSWCWRARSGSTLSPLKMKTWNMAVIENGRGRQHPPQDWEAVSRSLEDSWRPCRVHSIPGTTFF